jgi:hypothetical protein
MNELLLLVFVTIKFLIATLIVSVNAKTWTLKAFALRKKLSDIWKIWDSMNKIEKRILHR